MDLKNIPESRTGIFLVLVTAVISGFSIFINSIGVREFDSSIFTFAKTSAVALLLFAVITGIGMLKEITALKKEQWLQLAAIGLIGGSLPFLLFFQGLKMTAGATSGFIHKTIFVYVAIFALLFLKEKATKGLLVGSMLLLFGNYFMIKPDFAFSIGHVYVLLAVILWAAEYTYSKHLLNELSGSIVAFGRMFFGSVLIFAFLLAANKVSLIKGLTGVHYGWIVLTSLFLLMYTLTFYNGLKHVKVTTAACILSLGSPITTILALVFKGMPVSLEQSIGMMFIASGIISVLYFSHIYGSMKNFFSVRGYGRH